MGKYKVALGACGPEVIKSGVINAKDKREALVKYYEAIGEPYDDDKIESELKWVVEHVPKKREAEREDS